jgi:hypothetical protein
VLVGPGKGCSACRVTRCLTASITSRASSRPGKSRSARGAAALHCQCSFFAHMDASGDHVAREASRRPLPALLIATGAMKTYTSRAGPESTESARTVPRDRQP